MATAERSRIQTPRRLNRYAEERILTVGINWYRTLAIRHFLSYTCTSFNFEKCVSGSGEKLNQCEDKDVYFTPAKIELCYGEK